MARAVGKRGLIVCLVAAAGACLVGPVSADASFDTSTIRAHGSHGYSITIVGNNQAYPFGVPGNFVGITTHKGHAYASYNTGGKSTAKHIEADWGDFGKVDLRFHPKDSVNPPLPGPKCHGKYKRTTGIWKGTIKFKGENGYTKVSVNSAEGNHTINGVTCPGGGKAHKHVHLHAQTFDASFTSGATFDADLRKKPGAKPDFGVFAASTVGSVTIARTASVHGTPANFSFNGGYTHATVKPPAPFSGTATFDTPSLWTGSLKVDLPGAPNTVIAGTGWSASLGEESFKRFQSAP